MSPMQRHSHPYHIHLTFIRTSPPHIPMSFTNSVHPSPALWRFASTANFSRTMIYGGGVRVHVSRPLHHLYAVPTRNLHGFETLLTHLETAGGLESSGTCP